MIPIGSRSAWLLVSVSALAPLAACTGDVQTPEGTGESQSAIEGGLPVNYGGNPISFQFPLSTVDVETSGKGLCTGVLVSLTQVLTAAHCEPDATTQIGLYGTTGPLPTGVLAGVSQTIPVSRPPGVLCNPETIGPDGWKTCVNVYDGTWSDMVIVNLATALKTPYKPVALAPMGQFSSMWDSPAHVNYEVGAGSMNGGYLPGSVQVMEYVPVLLSGADGQDGAGSFATRELYGDQGDSGGPLYQPDPQVPTNLILMGILSAIYPNPFNSNMKLNEFTSVQDPTNYAWIWNQVHPFGPPPGTDVATFGAASPP